MGLPEGRETVGKDPGVGGAYSGGGVDEGACDLGMRAGETGG